MEAICAKGTVTPTCDRFSSNGTIDHSLIDKVRVWNTTRLLTIGRENQLIRGSHRGVRNVALMHTFPGVGCTPHVTEPGAYRHTMIVRIPEHDTNALGELQPWCWRP